MSTSDSVGSFSPRPASPGRGEVWLEQETVGVNVLDVMQRNGTVPIPLPSGLGASADGRIGVINRGSVTIIPFMPDGWDQSAGGFPAMTGNVPFLMKDVVLLAVSLYLLKQDLARLADTVPFAARAVSEVQPR
jgi:Protein of unknown function, DUF417